MTIKNLSEKPNRIEIDLSGPDGNAFVLTGTAKRLAKQLDKDADEIISRMMNSNYERLVQIFDEEFGDFVTIYG